MRKYANTIEMLIGLIVAVGFGLVVWTGSYNFTEPVELKTYDLRARLGASQERHPLIELVAVAEEDVSTEGQFPGSRDILAEGIENLAMAGAKVIAVEFLLAEPEQSEGLKAVRRLKESYESAGLLETEPGRNFYRELTQAQTDLDHDTQLRQAIESAGNVVLPMHFEVGEGEQSQQVPEILHEYALKKIEVRSRDEGSPIPVRASGMRPVLPFLADSAGSVGHMNHLPDADGTIRKIFHALCYHKETCMPSMALAIAAQYHDTPIADITLAPGQEIRWRGDSSPPVRAPLVGPGMGTFIRWNQGPDVAFHRTPFSNVLKKEVETSLFRDKVVIVGRGVPNPEAGLHTPIADNMPRMEVLANAVSNLLDRSFMTRPPWAFPVEFGVLVFFGLVLILVLPGMRAGFAALTALVLIGAYGAAASALFVYWNMWLKIAAPMLLLALGCCLLLVKRLVAGGGARAERDDQSYETNKVLGLSFQKEGRLDLALQKFRDLPADEKEVKELLYNLGISFEKKRQYRKALEAYEVVTRGGENYRDLDERIPKLLRAAAAGTGTAAGTHAGDVTLRAGEFQRTIGRYEVIDELGRGAMGVVYKGEDPKIHRTVAIKTINMGQFDEDTLGKMKERFFREAESAGLLAHPNIVTIYDCGEEGDLAYIAMEFLEGEDLEAYTEAEFLLPLREALRVAADVAEALSYAHTKNIVHRDIKPANIMRLRGNDAVKVTDFGIARITSSSQTKTGVVLGTPSYMSPEQVSGKKVDGRSDIFSLGIVLFQLLTGQKPFVGDDITTLMFKIAREPHPSLRQINPRIPSVVEKIVNKALEKDLKKRYQRAEHMANHLRQVIARIDAIQAGQTRRT